MCTASVIPLLYCWVVGAILLVFGSVCVLIPFIAVVLLMVIVRELFDVHHAHAFFIMREAGG